DAAHLTRVARLDRLGEPDRAVRRNLPAILRCREQGGGRGAERTRERAFTRKPGHHEEMDRILGGGAGSDAAKESQQEARLATTHPSPRRRRSVQSVASKPSRAKSINGASQRSCGSRTVIPARVPDATSGNCSSAAISNAVPPVRAAI